MRAIFKPLLLGAVALAAFGAPAKAADMLDAPYEQVPEVVPVEIGSGWYLRGDVSYDFKSKLDAGYRTYRESHDENDDVFSPARFDYGDEDYDDFEIDDALNGGIGFGYQFTDYFRGDLTAHYWKADVDGHDASAFVCDGTDAGGDPFPAGSTCRSQDSSELTAWELMGNAYVDLGTFKGITPYVGGGLGAVHVDYSDLSKKSYCVEAGTDCGLAHGGGVSFSGEDSWRFAYALMAGASYDLTRNLKVDLGYRYVNVDGGDMFGFDKTSKSNGASGIQGTDDGFDRQTVQVGLRYSLF